MLTAVYGAYERVLDWFDARSARRCPCGYVFPTKRQESKTAELVRGYDVIGLMMSIARDVTARLTRGGEFLTDDEKRCSLSFVVNRLEFGMDIRALGASGLIEYGGDIVVGFLAKADTAFSLKVGDRTLCEYAVKRGEFVYTYKNRFMIPRIALPRCEDLRVSIADATDVVVIFANVGFYPRRKLAQTPGYFRLDGETVASYSAGEWRGETPWDAAEFAGYTALPDVTVV